MPKAVSFSYDMPRFELPRRSRHQLDSKWPGCRWEGVFFASELSMEPLYLLLRFEQSRQSWLVFHM